MSIAFILRMISNTISGKGGHPQSINEEIERAKKRAAKRIYRAKVRAEDELGELDRVRITLMAGDMKKFTKEFSEIKNIDFHDCDTLTGLEHFNKERRNWRELEALSSKAMGLMNLSGGMDAIGFGAGVIDQYAVVPECGCIERNERAAAEIPAAGKEAVLPYAGCKTRSPPGTGCPS